MKTLWMAAIAAAGMSLPMAASACGYTYCHGAVGAGQNGEWAYSVNQWSEQDAINNVYAQCNGRCDVVKTFVNTCASIARGSNGAWGFDTEWNTELAASSAMNWCMDYGYNCCPVVSVCSQ